jgi:hypothetical protein
MSRIIDVDKAQEALDRAARNALYGSRDVRAGRFMAADATGRPPAGKPRAAGLRTPNPPARKHARRTAGAR